MNQMESFWMFVLIAIILFPLTVWNISLLCSCVVTKEEKKYVKIAEVTAMFLGLWGMRAYTDFEEIVQTARWDKQLYNAQVHSFLSPDAFLTIGTVTAVAFIGYIVIRFIPTEKLPPIIIALGIASVYLGIGISVVFIIQTCNYIVLTFFPANCIIVFVRTVYSVAYKKNKQLQDKTISTRFKKLSAMLNNATNLPWLALLLIIPLLGVIIVVLCLFGQEPNSIIKAWTDTADWTLSQRIPPPNLYYDEHYLCTVAASGHENLVRPIRMGKRHGHWVVVNRQLCVANAFEQVLMEKAPKLHKLIRGIYDNTGYPISKHIKTKPMADVVYILMKPLEWLFVLILYTVDVSPEDRIAIQYPHAAIPGILPQKET